MFTTPLGLLALLGVPAVILLHLFQRRFQPRVVSALFLWPDRDQSSPSGRRVQRLVRTPSFWCELTAALLLGLALGGPQACGSVEAQHLVVVLDSTASMAARPAGPGTESLAERALVALTERIGELPGDSRVTVIASGSRPRLLAGPAAFPGEAEAALESWSPGLAAHAAGDALALATELAGAGSVLFVTDARQPGSLPPNVELLALGSPSGNLAISAAVRTRNSDAGQADESLWITVQNFTDEPRVAQLRLDVMRPGGERIEELLRVELPLEAGARATRSFRIPRLEEAIRVALAPDELDLDNQAWLVPEPERTLSVTTTLNADLRYTLGLASTLPENPDEPLTAASVDRLLSLLPSSVLAPDPATAHLVISGAAAGGPRTWTLALESPGAERQDLIGPFLKALGNPIVAGTTLQGIVWSHAKGHVPPGVPLVSAGDTPLLTRDGRVFHLSLDPARSTLMRSPDWPVLLTNLAEARRRELPGPLRTNLRTGEELHYRLLEPARFRLTGPLGSPGGDRLQAEASVELQLEMPGLPGLYRLERWPLSAAPESPSAATTALAINLFGGGESDLRGLASEETPSEVAIAAAQAAPSWLRTLLILGALVALILDGFFLSGRRLTLATLLGRRPSARPEQVFP